MTFSSINQRRRGLVILAAALFGASFPAFAQPLQNEPPVVADAAGGYVFKPIEIKPSADGKSYEGRFLFINKGTQSTTYQAGGKEGPVDGKFTPHDVGFQILKDGNWQTIDQFICGTGMRSHDLEAGKEYQLVTSLDLFKEQDTRLIGRIGFGNFLSESFIMDWQNDRSSGKFDQARTEHAAKVRTLFIKAGFKEELLVGDDFCTRLFQSMMKETKAKDMKEAFEPFVGKLDALPEIGLNNNISIWYRSDDVRSHDAEYDIFINMEPRAFNHEWFRDAAEKHMEIDDWGKGFQMRFNNDNNSCFRLEVIYRPFEDSKQPSEEDAKRLFGRMMNVFDGWLK